MKAIVYRRYGSPEVLNIEDVPKPTPRDDEVLIKVCATSLNSSDCEFLKGEPIYVRMWGLLKPKKQILGSDIAGHIETVGKNAKRFKPGDEVFGDIFNHWGGLAEYVVAPENSLTLKPASITFEQAAAIPQAANVALQGLRYQGGVVRGQKVLINGAGGGAGSFAVQLAKHFGSEVTGVDGKEKLEMMRSIGSDHVIDYKLNDFTQNGLQYDLILDLVAAHSVFDYKRALSPEGRYVMAGGSVPHLFRMLFIGSLISMTGKKKMSILGVKPNKDLLEIIEMIESGMITPVIDKQYPFSETAEAFRYLGDGHARGKVVITM